jgi:hypothetical protein
MVPKVDDGNLLLHLTHAELSHLISDALLPASNEPENFLRTSPQRT